MAVHGGTDIVTDGLIHCTDALDKNSYIGSGTTVNNVIGTSTGTLTNATFNTSGYFTYDGTTDYITTNIAPPSGKAAPWKNFYHHILII